MASTSTLAGTPADDGPPQPTSGHAWRGVHAGARARRRRNVAGVRRRRAVSRTEGRRESVVPRARRRRQHRSVQTGNSARRPASTSACRAAVVRRGHRWIAVFHDAVGRRTIAWCPSQTRRVAGGRGDRDPSRRRQGIGVCSFEGCDPSRHQARQRPADGRVGYGFRFRGRESTLELDTRRWDADGPWRGARNARLYGAGTGRGGSEHRPSGRYLRLRRHGVRDARGPRAVRGQIGAANAHRTCDRNAGSHREPSAGNPGCVGRPGDAVPGETTRRPTAKRA